MTSGSSVPQPYLILWGSGVALSCAQDGQIQAEALHGLFAGDTSVPASISPAASRNLQF